MGISGSEGQMNRDGQHQPPSLFQKITELKEKILQFAAGLTSNSGDKICDGTI